MIGSGLGQVKLALLALASRVLKRKQSTCQKSASCQRRPYPSLVVPHIVQVLTLLLDDVLDPTSLLDEFHEVLVGDDSCE